jgi:glycosyltransferase involved in cell wall biosynthesis
MKRLRIAYAIIHANRREGQARPIAEVAERLARKHEVHLFSRTVADLDLTGIKWHRMPGPSWPAFADFLSYYLLAQQKVRLHEFDIVHSVGMNAPAANVIAIQTVQLVKRSFMKAAETQFGPLRRLSHWLYDRIACEAERRVYTDQSGRGRRVFLPVSQGVGRELRAHYAIGSASVCVIPNAADTTVFRPLSPEEKAGWRRSNGLDPSGIVIAFAGGEWARKGLEFALGALSRVREDNVKLLILGTDPEAARFQQLAYRLGVYDRVVFAGLGATSPRVWGQATCSCSQVGTKRSASQRSRPLPAGSRF